MNDARTHIFDVEYSHWSKFPMEFWRWPDFSPREIASRGDGKLLVNADAMDKLQAMRTMIGSPLMLNSAYRSVDHNRRVGGAKNSMHLKGRAFDVSVVGHNAAKLEYMARQVGFTGFGYYRRNNFLHFDTGRSRSWNTKWFTDYEPDVSGHEIEPETERRSETWRDDPILRGAATSISGGTLSNIADSFGTLYPAAQIIGVTLLGAGIAYIVFKRL